MRSLWVSGVVVALSAWVAFGACDKDKQGPRAQLPRDTGAAPDKADPGPLIEEARAFLLKGDANQAIARAWAIVEDHPKAIEARLVLASAYEYAKRHEEALRAADAALEIDPSSRAARLTKASSLAHLERYDEAIALAEGLRRDKPEDHTPHALLLDWYQATERWGLRAKILEDLIGAGTDTRELRVSLAKNHLRTKAYEPAIEALLALVKFEPEHLEAQLLLAATYYEMGATKKAMDRAEIAVKLDPGNAQATMIFRAAFYIGVSAKLTCAHGAGEWSKAQIDAVLAEYKREGLSDADAFHKLHDEFGESSEVKARIAKAAEGCKGEE